MLLSPERGQTMPTAVKKARRSARTKARAASRNGLVIRIMDNVDQFELPTSVVDHKSFRRWATSEELPEHGRFSFLDGVLSLDLSMERLNHNKVKGQITAVLTLLVQALASGHFLSDRMLVTNIAARLSTEPDAGFISYESLRRKRA